MKKQVMRWKHMAMVVLVLAAGLMYLSSWLPEETGWEKLTSSDESVPTQNRVSDAGEKEEVWESSHSLDVGNRDQTVQMESFHGFLSMWQVPFMSLAYTGGNRYQGVSGN